MNYKGIKISVGLDIHKSSWQILPHSPNLMNKSFNMSAPSSGKLLNYMTKNYPGGEYEFVYEAGFSGFGLARELVKAGHRCLVVNASDVPTTGKERKAKTDKVDARKLAQSLRAGFLRSVHIPDENLEDHRAVLSRRNVLVKDRARFMSRIRSRICFKGYTTENSRWSKAFIKELRKISKKDVLMEEYLDAYEYYSKRIRNAEKAIRELSESEDYKTNYGLICKIKGVGLITAMFFLTQIGDINRFTNVDKYCSFLGFVPGTHNSGDQEKSLGMTDRCNKQLRAMLIQSSWIFARSYPSVTLKFEKHCQKMIKSKAIVRIAKSLIKTLRAILISGKQPEFTVA